MLCAKKGVMRVATVAAAVASLGLLAVAEASAETFHAGSTTEFVSDVGKANAAAGPTTIVLAAGIYSPTTPVTVTNTSATLTVEGPSGSPTVEGGPATLDGSNVEPSPSELFIVSPGASVTFKDVEIAHGGGVGVPSIRVDGEPEGGTVHGGKVSLEKSLVSGNVGTGVTIEAGAEATMTNSTLSDNSGFAVVATGTASLLNSTVAFNKGGGVQNNGVVNLTNTIVAENKNSDCKGKATTSDHSLDSDGTCGVGALGKMNPMLGATLAEDGGTTLIHSLQAGSPAISAGDAAACTTEDQRGAPRPGISGKPCSIGADEYSNTPPTIVTPTEVAVEATSSAGAVVTYSAEAKGANDVATVDCQPESGKTFPVGTTKVVCTAEDGHENKATAEFNVQVTAQATAAAPTAVTGKASEISENSATLNATVNPNGTAVSKCTFEYAAAAFFELTDTYEAMAPCATLPGSGSSPVAVTAAISGLSASTTYHFRIVAENAATTTKGEGADETFKTSATPPPPASPPTAATGEASEVSETSATLNATVNPNATAVSKCTFEYGTSTGYGKTAPCATLPGSGSSPVAVTAAISGLSASTTYHFRIVAENAATTTKGEGADETFKTSATTPPPASPPTAATGEASEVSETSATLNATVNPNATAVSKCTFEYGTSTGYGKTAPCATLPGSGSSPVAVTAAISGLSASTTYHFRIVAENAATTTKGEGADETFKTSATPPPPASPPTAATGEASEVSETSATLNATVNPNATAVSKCTFEYGTSTGYGKTAPCATLPGSGSSPVAVTAAISGLSASTTYHFRIVAENAATTTKGEGADETFKTSATTPPPASPPTAATGEASEVSETSATLNATVNPNATAVSKCTFEYGTSTGYGKTAPCATLPGSGSSPVAVTAAISGLSASTTYHFRIVAENAATTTKGEGADETFKTSGAPSSASPEEAIRQLLEEVKSANLSRGIRLELVGPLKEALQDLNSPPRRCYKVEFDRRHRVLELDSACASRVVRGDLEQFVDVIQRDQGRRKRSQQIPASLASAWVVAAEGIEASLGNGSDGPCGHRG